MENFNKIKELVNSIEADAQKFYERGGGAAGTRVRKGMLELKKLAQVVRLEVSAVKNGEQPPVV